MGTSPLVSGSFWRQAAERAAKTAAQAVAAAWAVGDGLLDAFALDWSAGLGIALGGAVASLITSVASAPLGPQGTPSLVEVDPAPPHAGWER